MHYAWKVESPASETNRVYHGLKYVFMPITQLIHQEDQVLHWCTLMCTLYYIFDFMKYNSHYLCAWTIRLKIAFPMSFRTSFSPRLRRFTDVMKNWKKFKFELAAT